MNKILLPVLLAVTIVSIAGLNQTAYAGVSFYTISDDGTGGDCTSISGASWDVDTSTCTFDENFEFGFEGSLTVESGVTLVNNADMSQRNTSFFNIHGTFVNNGLFTAFDEPFIEIRNIGSGGGSTIFNFGTMFLGAQVVLHNTDDEIFNLGTLTNEGLIINDSIDTIENCGLLDSTLGQINPLGTINNYIGGSILGVPFNDINDVCPVGTQQGQAVAGEFIPIESISLLLAGVQTNLVWLLPVIVAGTGFVAFKLRRN